MKIGYSILLTEIVEAFQIEYGDCKDFQIVCPECMEPVFKKTRTTDGKEHHYMSHYKATAENQICELRVASYTKESIQRFNALARGQNLDEFITYLPSLMIGFGNAMVGEGMLLQMVEDRLKLPEFKQVVADFDEVFNRRKFRELAVEIAREFYADESIVRVLDAKKYTPMYVENQLKIANAFFDFFKTVPGKKIFAHVTAIVLCSSELAYVTREIDDPTWVPDYSDKDDVALFTTVVPAVKILATAKGLKLRSTITRLKREHVQAEDGSEMILSSYEYVMLKLCSQLAKTMVMLPYMDVLKRKIGKNSKLIKPTLN